MEAMTIASPRRLSVAKHNVLQEDEYEQV